MFTEPDTLLAIAGLVCVLIGIYLWLGLAATLILFGATLIFVGLRLDTSKFIKREQHEPD